MWKQDEEKTFINGRITVRRRSDDYMAYLDGDKRNWEAGKTAEEAIGKLVMHHLTITTDLVNQLTQEMELTDTEKEELWNLANAWENAVDTMAAIEPPSDYDEDKTYLKVYDVQDKQYDELFNNSSSRVKEALDRYLKLRS